MKKNEQLSDALGNVDERYISEYTAIKQKARRGWIKYIAVAAALTLTLTAAVLVLPPLIGNNDGNTPITLPLIEGVSSEYITDAQGNKVQHITNGFMGDALSAEKIYREEASAIVWDMTLNSFMTQDSSTLLVFKGVRTSMDSYYYEKTETVTDGGDVIVSRDTDGNITYSTVPGYEYKTSAPYERTVKVYISVIGYTITKILKPNNTSGYKEGDTVYIYAPAAYYFNEDGTLMYTGVTVKKGEKSPEDEERVFLISTTKDDRHIPEDIKATGLINVKTWQTIAACTEEFFNDIWNQIQQNPDMYK